MIINVSTIYYDAEGKQHASTEKPMYIETVKKLVDNWEDIKNKEYLNCITIKERTIIQAGGYSFKDGLFCDLYK